MAYQYPDNIPDYIKNLPVGAQKLFVEVFNKVLKDTEDEDKARMAGWGAVKNKYRKVRDKWVPKVENAKAIVLKYLRGEKKIDLKEHYDMTEREDGYYPNLRVPIESEELSVGDEVTITIKAKVVSLHDEKGKKTANLELIKLSFEKETLDKRIAEILNADREENEKARKVRSEKYGIEALESGHVTKPSEYKDVSDSDFADPVNYNYPMDTDVRAKAAVRYFGMPRNYGQYSETSRSKVWKRMLKLAKPHVKKLDETPPWERKE